MIFIINRVTKSKIIFWAKIKHFKRTLGQRWITSTFAEKHGYKQNKTLINELNELSYDYKRNKRISLV